MSFTKQQGNKGGTPNLVHANARRKQEAEEGVRYLEEFILFCYSELFMTETQISEVSGIAGSTLCKYFKKHKLENGISRNERNGIIRNRENHKAPSTAPYPFYNKAARMVTEWVYRKYATLIDPKGKRSRKLTLDHQLSIKDAFSKYDAPLSLTLLCHPANFKLLSLSANSRKQRHSAFGRRELISRIKKFEKLHGKIEFPQHFQLEFAKPNGLATGLTTGLRVMGFDPGSANFGVFGGELFGQRSLHRVRPVVSTLLKYPIRSLTDEFLVQRETFLEEVKQLMRKVKPHLIICERFQTRGIKGKTIELVSMMNALIGWVAEELAPEFGYTPVVRYVTAGTWKNAVNRKINLKEDLYAHLKPKELHRLDACLMSLSLFPDKDVYSYLTPKRQQGVIKMVKEIKQLEVDVSGARKPPEFKL